MLLFPASKLDKWISPSRDPMPVRKISPPVLIFLNQETSRGDRNRFIATQLDRGEGRCCGKCWHDWLRDDFEVVGSIPSTLNIFMPNLDFLGYFGVTQSFS